MAELGDGQVDYLLVLSAACQVAGALLLAQGTLLEKTRAIFGRAVLRTGVAFLAGEKESVVKSADLGVRRIFYVEWAPTLSGVILIALGLLLQGATTSRGTTVIFLGLVVAMLLVGVALSLLLARARWKRYVRSVSGRERALHPPTGEQ